ncbi:MAG: DUF6624 domain-containing protein [Candidatus Paceibacterota bacterium]
MSINKKLQGEISMMVKKDQTLRKRQHKIWINLNKEGQDRDSPHYKKTISALSRELKAVDRENTVAMKKIIKKYGWPGKSLVGSKGASQAWLLVQHADHDLNFQLKCLELLKKAAKSEEIDKKNLAFLTDRVLVHQKKKQIYGTQFKSLKTKTGLTLKPFPIKSPQKLDQLRKSVGLGSFVAYKKIMGDSLGIPH